jgi:predicted nucleotidyltransferase component of viral defense system
LDTFAHRPTVLEKIGRISDILVSIGEDQLLRDTLCLYGGTALNFLHFPKTPRLSEDLDFNYRHTTEGDWGDVRSEVDARIKGILHSQGYADDQFRIQPKYNIGRFHVKYTNFEGLKDTLKVEIGYTRRMPILKQDAYLEFHHPLRDASLPIMSPSREEIFANKFCTMLARKGPGAYLRDVFDVATMQQVDIDRSLMVDIILVESLMCELDPNRVRFRPLAMEQMGALQPMVSFHVDIERIREVAMDYTERILTLCRERDWTDFSEGFWRTGSIDQGQLENPDLINPRIEDHPLLLWIREKRGRRKL